jgi:putative DNA primase/helicase
LTVIDRATIDYARAIPIEDECARRNIRLKRASAVERVGPCPICGGTDRFSINIHKGVFNCRGCGGRGDIIGLTIFLDGCTFPEAIERLTGEDCTSFRCFPEPPDPARLAREKAQAEFETELERLQRLGRALWLWKQRQPVGDSIAESYLRRRGYTGPMPATLGFLPASGKYPPALIAAFGLAHEVEPGVIEIADNKITGIHLTRLLPDGSDRERGDDAKIMIGHSKGSPIVLSPPNDLLGLAITEGIEDGLSVLTATGLGVWAAGAANRLPALAAEIPSHVQCLTIYADADAVGRRYTYELATAAAARGFEILIEGAAQ